MASVWSLDNPAEGFPLGLPIGCPDFVHVK